MAETGRQAPLEFAQSRQRKWNPVWRAINQVPFLNGALQTDELIPTLIGFVESLFCFLSACF